MSPGLSAPTWRVQVVHDALGGRLRLRVDGLRSAPRLARALEIRLRRSPLVMAASVSPRTGSILVLFDPALVADEIRTLVRDALEEARSDRPPSVADLWADDTDGGDPDVDPVIRRPWSLEGAEVLSLLDGNAGEGLTPAEVDARRLRWGLNRIPVAPPRSTLAIALKQFDSVPVWLLLGSSVLSVATGGVADAVAILAVVAANAAVGTYTESISEKSISALPRGAVGPVAVLRDGRVRAVAPEDVVVGDILVLARGQAVAADARLLDQVRLDVDESALTGESMPMRKGVAALPDADPPLGERVNMVFRGTTVTGGSGRAVVVATGRATEAGRIQTLVDDTAKRSTPVELQLEQLGRQLAGGAGLASGAVFLIGLARGTPFTALLRSTVSLAVAAIPEGLPAVATTTLAFGVRRMRREGIYMRRLEVAEALGALQVLCVDKTGTLTANRMRVARVHVGDRVVHPDLDELSGEGETAPDLGPLLEVCVLNREEQAEGGEPSSPTEAALLEWVRGRGVDEQGIRERWRRTEVEPRSEERLYVKTRHHDGSGRLRVTVKGRPDQVLELCSHHRGPDGVHPLGRPERAELESLNEGLGGRGLRVLGMAEAYPEEDAMDVESRRDLIWLGLVALEDPIRPGARAMVERFRKAGVRTVMITGDQSSTAYAVARELGLAGDHEIQIVDSVRLTGVEPEVLAGLARQAHVFSRVSPAQKLLIVDVLQRSGLVVGMTGDGINDGPALRRADVGIALRTDGGEVAQEIADVVLGQGDLEGLLTAVASGRTLSDDIGKAVHFIASTNMSEVLFSLTAMAVAGEVPLNPKQLLWLNILSDVLPELALSVEPPETDVLARPPRDPAAPIIPAETRAHILAEAGILTGTTMAAYLWSVARHGRGPRAGTVAFMALTAAQLLHTISTRSETHSLFDDGHLERNRWVSWAIGSGFTVQLLSETVGLLRQALGNEPTDLLDALVIGGAAASSLAANETVKWMRIRSDHPGTAPAPWLPVPPEHLPQEGVQP